MPIQQARLRFVTHQHHLVRGLAPPRELSEDDDEGAMDADPPSTTANDVLASFFTDQLVRDTAADALARVGYNLAEVRAWIVSSAPCSVRSSQSSLAWNLLCAWELSLLRRSPS